MIASAVFVLMVLIAAIPFWLNRSAASVLQELHADLHVQQSMVDVLGELREAQSAQRAFMITGNEAFLRSYVEAWQRVPPLLQSGREHAHVESQRAILRRIEQLAGLALSDLDETIVQRRAKGPAVAAAAQETAVARGQPHLEELRRLVEAETARGQRQRERQRDRLLAGADRASYLGVAATAFGIGLLGSLLLVLVRALHACQARLRRLQTEAGTLASSVERSEHRNRELKLAADMLRAIAAAPSVEAAGPIVARCFTALLPGRAGAVFLLREGEEASDRLAAWNGAADAQEAAQEGAERTSAMRASDWSGTCATLRPGVSEAAAAGYGKLFCVQQACSCIPLVTQDGLIGTLHLDEGHDPQADPARRTEQAHLARWAAEQLALALGYARERERLRRQSLLDPLTGLFNRRYFDEAAHRELSRARRKALPTSLVVLDIDHFKRVNDTYGHGTGDSVLRTIAREIRGAIREGDIACRYGGEELVILIPECPGEIAAERAEELRAAIEACIPGAGADGPERITASFGVAEFPTHGSDAEALFRAADKAMYRAKHQGRNQVVAAG